MDLSTTNVNVPEIVAPAGNSEKLKFAVRFGADSVYFGGEAYNLRIKADNFTEEDILKNIFYCRKHNVKTIFLLNAFLHESDLDDARKYLQKIKKYNVDALMVSDPGMLLLIREAGIETDVHLSTQMSTLNHLSLQFWQDTGFKRIVLGRETTLDEIKRIREHCDVPIEIFAHGALCIAYSGRCLLSRYLTGRNANQGDCSQPCRWNFSLIEKQRPNNYLDIIEHTTEYDTPKGKGTEILSSKDLNLIEHLQEYADAGVNAFKLEGRMKSIYYTANVTRVYKHAARCIGSNDFTKHMDFWQTELDLVSHRPYTDDLFNEFDKLGYTPIPYIVKAQYLGHKVAETDKKDQIAWKTANPVRIGEIVEAIFPIDTEIIDTTFEVKKIVDKHGTDVDMARPNDIYYITLDRQCDDHAIFRKRLPEKKEQ